MLSVFKKKKKENLENSHTQKKKSHQVEKLKFATKITGVLSHRSEYSAMTTPPKLLHF